MSAKHSARIRAECLALNAYPSFIILNIHAIDCSSILSLKRSLRAHSASIKFYRNASIRLSLSTNYQNILKSIRGQHMLLILECNCNMLAICKLIIEFAKVRKVQICAFVWNGALYRSDCVSLVARLNNMTALKTNFLFSLKLTLFRITNALSFPLRNFVSLLNQTRANE
ncbi:50S ribosomal protein L10 [Candidatus Hodgkinia cicadicola]|nr:50S ribosomal protein L10 [Candidatus Hodgkinia cicadicola]